MIEYLSYPELHGISSLRLFSRLFVTLKMSSELNLNDYKSRRN